MSQISKARNRIMNRSKIISNPNEPQHLSLEKQNHPFTLPQQLLAEETFDLQPITATQYPKKFNISTISMKFTKNEYDQPQHSQSSPTQKYQPLRLTVPENNLNNLSETKRDKSPEFSRTQRINPIRHFEPNNMNTLSESNSRSGLYQKFNTKSKPRKVGSLKQNEFEMYQEGRGSIVKSSLQKLQIPLQQSRSQSPIRKIRKTVHPQQCSLLIAKQQRRRAQSPFKPRECLKSYVQKKIEEISQEKGTKFTDDQFPPRLTIMYPKKRLSLQQQFGIQFMSLSQIYDQQQVKVSLINTCQPTFLIPGYFTNPYLYSAVRILAENPSRVLSLFENQTINENGVYYIRLCRDGTWRYVMIDDMVPVRKPQEFQQNNRGIQPLCLISQAVNYTVQIWPSLLQKAIAKIYSTYYDLSLSRRDGVCPLLRLLTGYPVSKYDLIKDVRSYLILIDSALKRDHIVVLQQILPQFQYLAELKGLSIEQSYQILEISKNNFVLRNMNDLDLVTRLTFDEVMMFSSLLIFRKQDNFTYISQKLRHKLGYFSTLKVTVNHNTQCYWDVWQNNPAYYKNHCENKIDYEVSPFKLVIHPLNTDNNQYDSVQQPEMIVESGKQITMKKGEYLVNVHLCQLMREMDFTVSYYGEREVLIERMKNNNSKWHQNCSKKQQQKVIPIYWEKQNIDKDGNKIQEHKYHVSILR